VVHVVREPVTTSHPVRSIVGPVLGVLGVTLGLAALLLLGAATPNSAAFAKWLPAILIVNVASLIALFVLLIRKLLQLASEYRRNVPGSRLKARTVAKFGALAVAPLLVVYYFALQFLDRGIDSWFEIEVSQGLRDTQVLSRSALDLRVREFMQRTQLAARELSNLENLELLRALDRERRANGAIELSVINSQGRFISTSSSRPFDAVPVAATDEMLMQVRHGRPFVSLDTDAVGEYVIHAATPIDATEGQPAARSLIALFPVPAQLGQLADAVQRSYEQYARLVTLRKPLKSTFVLVLSFVVLVSAIAAVYGAFFTAQRLIKPVQDLIAGTRAVAKGNFDTKLPLPSRDEIGRLITSFNDMTRRLARSRAATRRVQSAVEAERTRLAVILARLSTGVVSLDADLGVRTANQAANAILGVDLETAVGHRLRAAFVQPLFRQFEQAVSRHLDAGERDWREQIDLITEGGKRVLMCACTTLPAQGAVAPGVVLVFDDITTLLQAQKDAAWGEVARRLAHEIKNPLTPIQLSAERMRRKLLAHLSIQDAQVLDRATHTIVQQVEAMKQMVNAFSDYARAPAMALSHFDLNQLIREVVELYRMHADRARINLHLDPELPELSADRLRIRQILNNLLTNSVEALEGREAPCIDIETRAVTTEGVRMAQITVTDNGPGFSRELLGTIFDPYVTSKPKGTGLGLAIVKKIVEEHGGRIDAENASKGGAIVHIMLPVGTDMADHARSGKGRDAIRTDMRREQA
jgi:PAS domain S-box-containing protein